MGAAHEIYISNRTVAKGEAHRLLGEDDLGVIKETARSLFPKSVGLQCVLITGPTGKQWLVLSDALRVAVSIGKVPPPEKWEFTYVYGRKLDGTREIIG